MRRFPILLALAALLGLVALAQPPADPLEQDVTQGALRVQRADGVAECPLTNTDVQVRITGFIARVQVTQTFVNPYDEKIEAVYVFPLSHTGAVDEMTLVTADRKIVGVIKRRAEARAIYEAAVRAGHTAALLEQEKPNIFRQSVGNIPPKGQVKVVIGYVDVLKYDMGTYEFHFPMVVGPRYKPTATGAPVAGDGQRSGHDIDLTLTLDAGLAIENLKVPSHKASVTRVRDTGAKLTLDEADRIPNKDFVFTYDVSGSKPRVAVLAESKGLGDGHCMLMLQPATDDSIAKAPPREFVFLVDVSGSMNGAPMEKLKETLRAFVKNSKPEDTLQVVTFASRTAKAFDAPQPATAENTEKALAFIRPIRGGGGTEMLPAVQEVVNAPISADKRQRIIVMLTDGYIGDESEVIKAVAARDRTFVKFWTLGIGAAPNRFLLDGVAGAGGGASEVIGLGMDPSDLVKKVVERMHLPQMTNLALDWGGLTVFETYPRQLPDLWAGKPVIVYGRFMDGGEGVVKLTGTLAGTPVTLQAPVVLPFDATEGTPVLDKVWARRKIDDLSAQVYYADDPTVAEEITNIALQHRLMSRYTSFVAVDEKTAAEAPQTLPRRVEVAIPLPAGVGLSATVDDIAAVNEALLFRHAEALSADGTFSTVTGTPYGGDGRVPTSKPTPADPAALLPTMGFSRSEIDLPAPARPGAPGTVLYSREAARGPAAASLPDIGYHLSGRRYDGKDTVDKLDGEALTFTSGDRVYYGDLRKAPKGLRELAEAGEVEGHPDGGYRYRMTPGGATVPSTGITFDASKVANVPVPAAGPISKRGEKAAIALAQAQALQKRGDLDAAFNRFQQAALLAASAVANGVGDAKTLESARTGLQEVAEARSAKRAAADPTLARKLDLVIRDSSLEDALDAVRKAAGIPALILTGLDDAKALAGVRHFRILYLDLTGQTVAQALDTLTLPRHLTWSGGTAGLTVAPARYMPGVSSWTYDIRDLVTPLQDEAAQPAATDILALVRSIILQRDESEVAPHTAALIGPTQLMVTTDAARHADVAKTLTALQEGDVRTLWRWGLRSSIRTPYAPWPPEKMAAITAARWKAREADRSAALAAADAAWAIQVREAALGYGRWQLLTEAAAGKVDLEALTYLQAAWKDSTVAEPATYDARTARTAWTIGLVAARVPDHAELKALATAAVKTVDAMQAKDPAAPADGVSPAAKAVLAGLRAGTAEGDAAFLEAVKNRRITGEDVFLAVIAARTRGGTVWEQFRVLMPEFMGKQALPGHVVVAANRWAALPIVAKEGEAR